jgi:hypothetical protein
MPKICIQLSDEIALRFRELALQKTGSLKGLSIVGAIAIEEYLMKRGGDEHDRE